MNYIGRLALIPLTATALLSCGERVSSESCGGAESNGICFMATSIMPEYDNAYTRNVDIYPSVCEPGPPAVLEVFTDHGAEVVLSAFRVGSAPAAATRIRLLSYEISYTLNPGSDSPALGLAIPSVQGNNFGTGSTFEVPVDGTLTVDLSLFDVQQKDDFVAANDPNYPNCSTDPVTGITTCLGGLFFDHPSYTAHFTFYGEDEYGRAVWTSGSAEIKIGGYNYCG